MKFVKNKKLFCYERGNQRSFQIIEMTSKLVCLKPSGESSIKIVFKETTFKEKYWMPEGKTLLV